MRHRFFFFEWGFGLARVMVPSYDRTCCRLQTVTCIGLTTLDQADFSAWHAVREQVAIYSGWATLVWMLHSLGWMPMTCSAGMLVGIFSMVTGLLVSFRATSSYER